MREISIDTHERREGEEEDQTSIDRRNEQLYELLHMNDSDHLSQMRSIIRKVYTSRISSNGEETERVQRCQNASIPRTRISHIHAWREDRQTRFHGASSHDVRPLLPVMSCAQ